MARNQAEFCILCTNAPCTCEQFNAPKKTARKLPAPKKSELPPPVVETPEVQAPPALSVPTRRTGLLATTHTKKASQDRDTAEIEERNALTILCRSELICWEDIVKHQHQLNMTPQEVRLLVWKQKRRAAANRR